MSDQNVIIDLKVTGDQTATDRIENVGRRGAAGLKMLEGGARRAGSSLDQMTRRMTGGNLPRFGLLAQQVGYQVQDFGTQVAQGTSSMVAFGQNAPQLLGFFGPFGAGMGAAIAVMSAFGNSLFGIETGVESAADKLEEFTDAIDAASAASVTNIEALASQVEAYGRLDAQLLETIRLKAQLALLDARDAAGAGLGAVTSSAEDALTFGTTVPGRRGRFPGFTGSIMRRFGLDQTTAETLNDQLAGYDAATDFDERRWQLSNLRVTLGALGPEAMQDDDLRAFTRTVVDATLAVREFEQAEIDVAETALLTSRPIAELRAEMAALAQGAAGGGSSRGRGRPAGRVPIEDYGEPFIMPTPRPLTDDQIEALERQQAQWERLTGTVEDFGAAASRGLTQMLSNLNGIAGAAESVLQLFIRIGAETFVNTLVQPLVDMGVGAINNSLFGPSPRPAAGGFTGGTFMVPGYGGHDSVATMMRLSPGETVSINRRGGSGSHVSVTQHFHGQQDMGTMRRATSELEYELGRAVGRGGRHR